MVLGGGVPVMLVLPATVAALEKRHGHAQQVPRHLAGEGGSRTRAPGRPPRGGGGREPGAAPKVGGAPSHGRHLAPDAELYGETNMSGGNRKQRIQLVGLTAGLLVWALVLYWRFEYAGPAESRPAAAVTRRDAAKGTRP